MDADDMDLEDRRRLQDLRADALGLAMRYAREGTHEAGPELAAAVKESLEACEAVLRDVIAATDGLGPRLREEHAGWLRELRARLLQAGADAHREAEAARLAKDELAATSGLLVETRCEALAASIGELASRT